MSVAPEPEMWFLLCYIVGIILYYACVYLCHHCLYRHWWLQWICCEEILNMLHLLHSGETCLKIYRHLSTLWTCCNVLCYTTEFTCQAEFPCYTSFHKHMVSPAVITFPLESVNYTCTLWHVLLVRVGKKFTYTRIASLCITIHTTEAG